MALDKTTLENLIVRGIQDSYASLYPDAVIAVTIAQVPKEVGSTEYVATETKGPLTPDEKAIRAMARGIAHGIVEHLRGHTEVVVDATSHEGGIS